MRGTGPFGVAFPAGNAATFEYLAGLSIRRAVDARASEAAMAKAARAFDAAIRWVGCPPRIHEPRRFLRGNALDWRLFLLRRRSAYWEPVRLRPDRLDGVH